MWFLEHLKDVVKIETPQTHKQTGVSNLDNDPLTQELRKRIKEIDDGSVELISHVEVMSRIYSKWEQKCM